MTVKRLSVSFTVTYFLEFGASGKEVPCLRVESGLLCLLSPGRGSWGRSETTRRSVDTWVRVVSPEGDVVQVVSDGRCPVLRPKDFVS